MKKIILFLMVLFTTGSYAQSDFEIAQSFMNERGVKLAPNERSTTRGTDAPYSIFNGSEGKGFCIVVNGKVAGYDTNNTVDDSDIPCCLKVLLETYSSIVPKGRTRGEDPDWWTPRNVTPIEPLIQSHWSQSSPYNDLMERKNGICTIVAFCQLLHYFRVPQTYKGIIVNDTLTLPITYFDHNKILDEYKRNTYSKDEAEEVAKLFYYYSKIDSHGLYEYLGMELAQIGNLDSDDYYTDIDKCLDENIPFWAAGSCSGAGHAFVVDGRDSEGRYHINFGWGGLSDGYYILPDGLEHRPFFNETHSTGQKYASYAYGGYATIPKAFEWKTTSNISSIHHILNYNGYVYNLQGRKVGNSLEGLPKGVYIQNKKKYIIK